MGTSQDRQEGLCTARGAHPELVDALFTVETGMEWLWRPHNGAPRVLAYLREVRGLADQSIRAAKLGRPVIVAEGEFDTLLLGKELGDAAVVITLGSAALKPTDAILDRVGIGSGIFLAHDADDAGDRAASAWPCGVRVRPPAGKDWCEARKRGVDLRAFWAGVVRS
jgi:hypothetical protein